MFRKQTSVIAYLAAFRTTPERSELASQTTTELEYDITETVSDSTKEFLSRRADRRVRNTTSLR